MTITGSCRPCQRCWWKRPGTTGIAPAVGVRLARRRQGQPAATLLVADKALRRLCRRYRRLTERRLPAGQIVVAIARELTGFLWAALQAPAPAT